MTTLEVIACKEVAEQGIAKILAKFYEETGVSVAWVSILSYPNDSVKLGVVL